MMQIIQMIPKRIQISIEMILLHEREQQRYNNNNTINIIQRCYNQSINNKSIVNNDPIIRRRFFLMLDLKYRNLHISILLNKERVIIN